jgi:ATP-binding cassette subfamily B protein
VTASIAAVAMLLTYIIVSLSMRAKLRDSSEIWARTATERVKAIQEGLGGIRDILLDQSQAVFQKNFNKLDLRYRQAQTVSNFIATAPRYLVEAASIILIGVIAVYMTHRPGGLVAAIPMLGALAVGAQRLLPLLQQSYNGWSAFRGNQQMLIDVAELLQAPIVDTPPRHRILACEAFRRDIILDSVSFHYPSRQYALRNISFRVAKGQRIGIIGRTGSGKSTLVDILMGLLEPSSGEIRIDGVPLNPKTIGSWQGQIAHVPQMIYLSDSTIATNIAFGEAEEAIDMARVRAAARQAEIDDFIDELAQGYETVIGERGIRLSGGQRQRLGIARALYKEARVLIFDEATSALDHQTEKAIMESIGRLSGDVTMLIIAHRITTLSLCDAIVRLDGGTIAETGSHLSISA